MTPDQWLHAVLAVFFALGGFLVVTQVGKPRKSITGGVAAATVLVDGLLIAALIVWWPS